MRIDPAPRGSPALALLDDMSGTGACSRLYLGHAGTLTLEADAALDDFLSALQRAVDRGLHPVGLFAYELGESLHGIRHDRAQLAQVMLFSECRRLSHEQVDSWLDAQSGGLPSGVANVRDSVSAKEFDEAIGTIAAYIAAGDTYQVNYTYRIDFEAYGPTTALYRRLRQRQRVPYGALIVRPDGASVLSLSPELFVRHAAGQLLAKPMKGTARAYGCEDADRETARVLAADAKNRAENVMIVDLLRNDLGRIAKTGSVRVPALFEVGRFGSVLQMTSTVTAEPRLDCTLADLFRAVFPCGSITGAPKRRSMQVIDELESRPRGLYTGAIAWFESSARKGLLPDFCMSVPIRTLSLRPPSRGMRVGEMGVGAGIVADSVARDEHAECRLKASFLTGLGPEFGLIETMRATPERGCALLQRHLWRLAASARYFGIPVDVRGIALSVTERCKGLEAGQAHRMRVDLHPDGRWSIECAALDPLGKDVRVVVSPDRLDADDIFLRHKTTARSRLDAAWREADSRGAFDSLLFNHRGELAQGGRTNVFVKLEGRWYTPPLQCGVLPGVMRDAVLDDAAWNARERVLTFGDVQEADALMVCNALRGTVAVTLVDAAAMSGA